MGSASVFIGLSAPLIWPHFCRGQAGALHKGRTERQSGALSAFTESGPRSIVAESFHFANLPLGARVKRRDPTRAAMSTGCTRMLLAGAPASLGSWRIARGYRAARGQEGLHAQHGRRASGWPETAPTAVRAALAAGER